MCNRSCIANGEIEPEHPGSIGAQDTYYVRGGSIVEVYQETLMAYLTGLVVVSTNGMVFHNFKNMWLPITATGVSPTAQYGGFFIYLL